MAQLGNVWVKIFAQVGDSEQYELGSIVVPLKVKTHGKGYEVDLEGPFDAVKAVVQQVFSGDAE